MFRKILIAYDGSAGADAALERGLELAAETNQELWMVSVQDNLPDFAAPNATPPPQLTRLQNQAAEKAAKAKVTLHPAALAGNVAKQIVEHAQTGNFDLLVIGQSGRSGVWGNFLGTTADKVVRHAPCSVLVIRPTTKAASAEATADQGMAKAPSGTGVGATTATTTPATVVCPTCGELNQSGTLTCVRCREVLPLPR